MLEDFYSSQLEGVYRHRLKKMMPINVWKQREAIFIEL